MGMEVFRTDSPQDGLDFFRLSEELHSSLLVWFFKQLILGSASFSSWSTSIPSLDWGSLVIRDGPIEWGPDKALNYSISANGDLDHSDRGRLQQDAIVGDQKSQRTLGLGSNGDCSRTRTRQGHRIGSATTGYDLKLGPWAPGGNLDGKGLTFSYLHRRHGDIRDVHAIRA